MLKFVFLDLDETIFDFPLAERNAIFEALSKTGITPTDEIAELYSKINRSLWDRLERGTVSRERLKTERFEVLFSEIGVKASATDMQKAYEKALGGYHYFINGAEEVLSELAERYELYAVTNGLFSVQSRRIKDAKLDRFFKGYFISEEIGASKPEKTFFDKAFSSIKDFDPSYSVIIGDSIQSDILGGKNAGILTCHYNPKQKENLTGIIPDYEIKALCELPALLNKL